MGQTAKPPRENRTITGDFHDETTYFALLGNTKRSHSIGFSGGEFQLLPDILPK
jgi:hypothetical protein